MGAAPARWRGEIHSDSPPQLNTFLFELKRQVGINLGIVDQQPLAS